MASSRARVRQAAQTGRVVRGANFETKSQRKARRKRQVAGLLANRVVDARVGFEDRMTFYRKLREMKLRRRAIADAMRRLAVVVNALHREVGRIDDRGRAVNTRLVDEALGLTKEATIASAVAADEFYAFSRSRIYYQGVLTS
ncbi:hypothetical protein AB0C44_33430 [Micromonospora taraxaci]|uniref:hypothetical protein n=1 Tax=Micromonospora taraxaci TaxID=1316803 RepID=UPI0033EA08D3